MNELNKADSQAIEKNKQKKPAPPSANMVKEFKQLFTNAEQSIQKTEPAKDQKNTKPTTQSKASSDANNTIEPNTKQFNFEFKKEDPSLAQLFNEMGISTLKQIDAVLIQVTQHIEQSTQTNQPLPTFMIKFDNHQSKLTINAIKNPNGYKINLTSDPGLITLLGTHLTELKAHLKKKNIEVDDIILTEELEKESAIIKRSEKNNT
ncbi:MAG: hypothetical protein VW397_01460 [Candidatus Margulisiibacteriota bacterium]